MDLHFCNSNDKNYQRKLNVLLKDVFFDFSFWYDLDLWDENYESYSFEDCGEIISNICVFKTRVVFREDEYEALSVGAVATKEGYRGRGYSKRLMEHIFSKYPGRPLYLYADREAFSYYEKLGFRTVYEKIPTAVVAIDNNISPGALEHTNKKVYDYIYNSVNYSKDFDCLNTASINIFHLYSGQYSGKIYELPALQTMVVASQDKETLHIFGIFSKREITFVQLRDALPFRGIRKLTFGCMPPFADLEYTMEPQENGEPLFVKNVGCDLGEFKFPELSVT